jgi:hypothetical protein
MSLFEFLMVLVSIIIGLGIAEILTGTAKAIRCRGSIQGYWVLSILAVVIFVALLQQWWEIWGLHDVPTWSFPGLMMMLAGPVGLFLIAHLLFPEPMQGAIFREHYYGVMRPLWWLAMLTIVLATLFRPLIFHEDLLKVDNAASLIGFFAFFALAVSKNRILHAILVPVILLLLLMDVFLIHFIIGQD